MQDWDRLAMLIIGIGVACYTLYGGWRHWRAGQRSAAFGTLLLALATVIMPILLVVFGQ